MTVDEWETFILGDLCQITSSKRIFAEEYVNVGIPFYRSREVIEKALGEDITLDLFIPKERYYEIKKSFGAPQKGDILISSVGNRSGIPYLVKGDEGDFYFKDGNVIWFKDFNNKLNSKYLSYWLKSSLGQNALDSIMIGSAQKALTIIGISGLSITLPHISVQEHIADVLSSLDDKIEVNRRMNATLESMARAVFREMIKDGEGEEETIGDVVMIVGGSTPSTTNPSFWDDGDINWATPKDLAPLQSPFLLETNSWITELGLQEISSGLLPAGTVLLSSRAPIGYLAITQIPVAINQGFIAIKCTEEVPNYYILNWLKENMEEIIGRANGTTFLEISKSNFRPMKIIVSPPEKMKTFVQTVEPLYQKIVANLKESRTLASLRDSLLPKLMRGEVRVRNVEGQL